MPKQAPARILHFASLNDAVEESRKLLASGYRATGQWDLAACLEHCNTWLASSFEKPIATPLMMRPIFWIMRQTAGPKMLKKIIAQNSMAPGVPTAKETVFLGAATHNQADAAAVEKIRQTIERFENHDGKFLTSPVFGKLDRVKAEHLHRVHLAHHLGYLVPAESSHS